MASQPYIPIRPRDPAERYRFKCRRLVWRMVHGTRAAQVVERELTLRLAQTLAGLRAEERYRRLGHVRFADFCLEVLQLHPRTARRHVALWDVLSRVPSARTAFLAGRVDVSRILALRTVLTGATAPAWLARAQGVPVRELRELVKAARSGLEGDGGESGELTGGEEERGSGETGPTGGVTGNGEVAGSGEGTRSSEATGSGTATAGEVGHSKTSPEPPPVRFTDQDLEEPERERITFLAPQTSGLAFEHALETGRRLLGWDAPADACLDAMLAEAETSAPWLVGGVGDPPGENEAPGSGGVGAAAPVDDTHGHETPMTRVGDEPPATPGWAPGGRLPWADRPFVSARRWRVLRGLEAPGVRRRMNGGPGAWDPSRHRYDYKRAAHAFSSFRRVLGKAERLAAARPDDPPVTEARALLARYLELEALGRPLFVARTRLLYHLDVLHAGALFGLDTTDALASRLLGLSERAALEHYWAGCQFQFDHTIADAYIRGDIGLSHVVNWKLQSASTGTGWIRRARSVTCRQLRREMQFLRRLNEVLTAGPFGPPELLPDPAVEAALRKRLFKAGWGPGKLDRELEQRGLLDPPGASKDPAENPAVMDRLETMLDMVILSICRTVSDDDPEVRYRKTLSTPGRHHRVVIWARPEIRERWGRACRAVRRVTGAWPEWAVAVLVARVAMNEWERQDPDRTPTERRILERDGYRCQAPGCSSRSGLESHHIRFRSQGGSNTPSNRVTLCHAHHHHAIHAGTLRVSGRAPHALLWEFGCAPGAGPLWVYRGERLVRGPGRVSRGPSRREPDRAARPGGRPDRRSGLDRTATGQVPTLTSRTAADRPSVWILQK